MYIKTEDDLKMRLLEKEKNISKVVNRYLRIKLKQLDKFNLARLQVANHYDRFFSKYPQIKTPERAKNSTHVFHQYTLQLDGIDRDELKAFLAEREIPAMIYYPIPAHKQKMFEAFDSSNTVLPITDDLTKKVISLPIHTEMTTEQLDAICQGVSDFLNK